jgi:prophage DNA circulation protein
MQSIRPSGPTAQMVTDEIGALEMATRGTRIVVDTLQSIHLLSPKTVDSIARVLADNDAACTSARTRLQAGDVSGAASTIRTAQAEFANDADIKQALAQAEQLLRDPEVRAALRVVRIDPARSR